MLSLNRPLLKQEAVNFTLAVQTVATPINANMQLTAMIDTVLICVPQAAANNIFFGFDAGTTVTSGIEIVAGTTIQLVIDHEGRQLYELQGLLSDGVSNFLCKSMQLEAIPFVVWDVSQIYLVAAAATTVAIACFKAVYV